MSINFFDFIIMTEREFRQNGENQSGRDGRKSYNNREGYNRNNRYEGGNYGRRSNNGFDGGERQNRSSFNPRFNNNGGERQQRGGYGNNNYGRQQRSYGNRPVSLLQDLTMTVENNARSVLVRDNREDIVSRVEAMEIIVKAVSVRVQLTIIRMLNIA